MPQLAANNALGFLLADTARLYRQAVEDAVDELGIVVTAGEIRALSFVARYSGARQAVLAEHMGVEPMTLSAYLDRLEARGLIRRRPDPRDRRAKVIELTDNADMVFEDVRPLITQVYERCTKGLSDADRQVLEGALQVMRANLTRDPGALPEDSRSSM